MPETDVSGLGDMAYSTSPAPFLFVVKGPAVITLVAPGATDPAGLVQLAQLVANGDLASVR